jgi:hypothetical protein
MMKVLLAAAAIGIASMTVDPAAQTSGRGATAKRPASGRTASVRVSVKDPQGSPLTDARILVSTLAPTGASELGTFTTGAAGTAIIPNLKDGTYRVRCEHDGFVTLEREFAVRGGAWNPIDLVLEAAPKPPPPPAPEPPPAAALPPSGPPVMMSLLDFLDKNFIGREPIKESILACEPLETVRLLQMHDGIARHVHDRIDEIIYVVAGEGTVHIGEAATALRPGSLAVVPHGKDHSFDRTGKNPLVVLSTLTGAPCEPQKTTP